MNYSNLSEKPICMNPKRKNIWPCAKSDKSAKNCGARVSAILKSAKSEFPHLHYPHFAQDMRSSPIPPFGHRRCEDIFCARVVEVGSDVS